MNVARASLEELLLDYEDYLRHRHLTQWSPDSAEAREVRDAMRGLDGKDLDDRGRFAVYARWLDHADPAVRANALICLIHQANYLLDRQIDALEREFVEEGGYSEQLATARIAERERKRAELTSPSKAAPPPCPLCGKTTVLRTAKKGKTPGRQLWGCTGYPECKGLIDI